MSGLRKKIASNFAWLVSEKLVSLILAFGIGVLVARYLGPQQFGKLSYALAITSFFVFLSDLGFGNILVREISTDPDSSSVLLKTAFILRIAGGLIAALLSVLCALLVGRDQEFLMLVMVMALGFVVSAGKVFDSEFQASLQNHLSVVSRLFGLLVGGLARISLVLLGATLIWFGIAILIENLAAALAISLFWFFRHNRPDGQHYDRQAALSLLKDSLPLAGAMLLIALNTRIDQVMVGSMLGDQDVGYYAIAIRLSELWFMVPTTLVVLFQPVMIQLRERDPRTYRERMRQLYAVVTWGGIVYAAALSLGGRPLITFLFGEAYAGAFQALPITVWLGVFVGQGVARGIWLIGENLQVYRLWTNAVLIPVNMALNFFLIPRFGIAGAASATLLAQVLGLWGITWMWRPMRSSNRDMLQSFNPGQVISAFAAIMALIRASGQAEADR